MSENSGLDTGKPEFTIFQKGPRLAEERKGYLKPAVQREGYDDKFDNQNIIKDDRYSPFQRGEMNRKNYRYQPPLVDKEKCVKKDPFKQAVSFIPRTKLLMEQPAVTNSAAADWVRLDYNPIKEIPDQTVCNNISEIRHVRQSNKKLMSLLDTRAQARRRIRQRMWDISPDLPRIVDVKQHRKSIYESSIIRNLESQNITTAGMPIVSNRNLRQQLVGY